MGSKIHSLVPKDSENIRDGNPSGNMGASAVVKFRDSNLRPWIPSGNRRLQIRQERNRTVPLPYPSILNVG